MLPLPGRWISGRGSRSVRLQVLSTNTSNASDQGASRKGTGRENIRQLRRTRVSIAKDSQDIFQLDKTFLDFVSDKEKVEPSSL